MVVTFFGHSEYIRNELDEQRVMSLLSELIGVNPVSFYLGGYGNFDEFARGCAVKYKENHPGATTILVTPYITLNYQKNHLEYQKHRYDSILYPELENVPPKFAIAQRNKWMVKNADIVIAYVTHTWGGAYKAYKYAQSLNKHVINIAKYKQ